MKLLGIAKIFDSIIGKADSLIDNVSTTQEEKLEKKNELHKIISDAKNDAVNAILAEKELDIEEQKIRAETVNKEIDGTGIQKNWRPIVSLGLFFIIFSNMWLFPLLNVWLQNDAFGALIKENTSNAKFWELLSYCLGGYTFTRTGEKIVKTVMGGGSIKDIFKKSPSSKDEPNK